MVGPYGFKLIHEGEAVLHFSEIGISVDLLRADANDGDGGNFGYNPAKSVGPGASRTLTYYCGRFDPVKLANGQTQINAIPEAFGVCGMRSWGDVIKQGSQGLLGAVIVEPADMRSGPTTPAPWRRSPATVRSSASSCWSSRTAW